MTDYKFVKENGGWYIDLPDWPGSKGALAMVMGADTMLELISEGDSEVKLGISLEPCESDIHLKKRINMFGGAFYKCTMNNESTEIWLCGVTKYVFGKFPKNMYIKQYRE